MQSIEINWTINRMIIVTRLVFLKTGVLCLKTLAWTAELQPQGSKEAEVSLLNGDKWATTAWGIIIVRIWRALEGRALGWDVGIL